MADATRPALDTASRDETPSISHQSHKLTKQLDWAAFETLFTPGAEEILAQDYADSNLPLHNRATLTDDSSHWQRLKRALSRPPTTTTVRINDASLLQKPADDICSSLASLTSCNHFSKTPLHDVYSVAPRCQSTGELSSPMGKPWVLVGQGCGCAVLRGADVYAPGVRAICPRVSANDSVAVFVDIHDRCLFGATHYDGEVLFVGNGRITMSRWAFFQLQQQASQDGAKPSGLTVEMVDSLYGHPSFNTLEPELHLQNLPSCYATEVLDPQPGDIILDMCAAPGGKTAHIATRLAGHGQVVAFERSKKRAEKLSAWISSMGHGNIVTVVAADATRAIEGSKGTNRKFEAGTFDRVLLDAPCSGLGQRPRMAFPVVDSESSLAQFGEYQKKLLGIAAQAVKPGGRLVYSTCTINPRCGLL